MYIVLASYRGNYYDQRGIYSAWADADEAAQRLIDGSGYAAAVVVDVTNPDCTYRIDRPQDAAAAAAAAAAEPDQQTAPPCLCCGGEGWLLVAPDDTTTCWVCKGSGHAPACEDCGTDGHLDGLLCAACGGEGYRMVAL